MKYAKYSIEEKTMEVYNSILGIESVHVNGRKVSKGFSFFGSNHDFKLGQDNFKITTQLSFYHFGGVEIRVFKNGDRIKLENKISQLNKRLMSARFICLLLLGGFIGWNINPAYNWVLQYLGL